MALIDNLVSYYKLDETSGTTATDSHGSNNGTISGATVNVAGKIDKAYDFDGTNDYVSIPDDNSLDLTQLTINMWVKLENINKYQDLIYKGIYGTRCNYAIRIHADNRIGLIYYTSSWREYYSSTTISAGSWTMLTVTYDASQNIKIYKNGANILNTSGSSLTVNNDNLFISSTANGALWADGVIDEVGIWSRALSSTEVSELYNSGDGLAYPFVTDTIVNVSAALTLSTDDAEPTININVPIITFEQGLTLQNSTLSINCNVNIGTLNINTELINPITVSIFEGTVGTAAISKNFPIEENRTWETVQYLVPDVDLTIRKNRIGLGNC